jgi:hypothetical protein
MVKLRNLHRWIYGHLTGKPTNFYWVIKGKLAGSGLPTSLSEVKWSFREKGIQEYSYNKRETLVIRLV